MATSLAPQAKHEDWAELRNMTDADSLSARAGWLWTLVGVALLGAFLAFVVEDFPLRGLIAGQ